jgi:uncharacterized protein
MRPYFRKENYYEGIHQGVLSLMQAAAGKYKGSPRRRSQDGKNPIPFIFFFLLIMFLLSLFRKRQTTVGSRGWRTRGPFFFGGTGSSWGSSGGGSWGGFGGGGGGFSAGGGSFGGGGATGSW